MYRELQSGHRLRLRGSVGGLGCVVWFQAGGVLGMRALSLTYYSDFDYNYS